jgi:hypothetical protein
MKYKSCGIALALALAVGFILTASSFSIAKGQEQDKAKPAPPAQETQDVTISGKVTGSEKNMVIVTDDMKAEHKVAVTSETKVTKGGKEATAADLKANAKVTVQARKASDGSWTALTIDIVGE